MELPSFWALHKLREAKLTSLLFYLFIPYINITKRWLLYHFRCMNHKTGRGWEIKLCVGWVCLVVVEPAQIHNETNMCHPGHQNSSGLGQARAGKHVGLVTPPRTIMSLPFPRKGSSQRSVSTVVLIKPQHLPVVSGTWHFPGRSMCCTHTLSLRFLGSIKLYSHSVQALNTNILDLHMAYCSLKNPLFSVGMVSPELPGSMESCGLQKELGFSGAVQVWSVYFLWAILSSSLLFLLGKEILEK